MSPLTLVMMILTFLHWSVASACAERVKIKWNGDYPHNNERVWSKDYELGWSKNFMNGTPQERGVVRRDGFLNAELIRIKRPGPHPYIILMHGCAGMDSNTKKWAHEYTDFFSKLGLGVLVLDSFTTRNVKESCGKPDGHWARRRSEDAYSALDYLVASKDAEVTRIFLLGRSNGGNATIMALEDVTGKYHPNKFAMGFALAPPCGAKVTANFYAPLFIFVAGQDDANPPQKCIDLVNYQRKAGHPVVKAIVYGNALHGYMDRVAAHRFHGWRMGYNKNAAQDTLSTIARLVRSESIFIGTGVERR